MKFNKYQKAILICYGLLFIYFSVIHVPFKSGYNEIEYNTLFSNKSNIDISRLSLIIVIISILTIILLLLCKNLQYSFNLKSATNKKKIILLGLIGFTVVIALCIVKYKSNNNSKVNNDVGVVTDSTSVSVDSTIKPVDDSSRIPPFDLKKAESCTEENALFQFKSYMQFNYPDWKIYGKPVVKESSDCTYQIRFTTMNPHIRYEKEVFVAEISFDYDYSHYYFRTIRGTLY